MWRAEDRRQSFKGVLTPNSNTVHLMNTSKCLRAITGAKRPLGPSCIDTIAAEMKCHKTADQTPCDIKLAYENVRHRSCQPIKLKVVGPFPLGNMYISREWNRCSFGSLLSHSSHFRAVSELLNVAHIISHQVRREVQNKWPWKIHLLSAAETKTLSFLAHRPVVLIRPL